MAARAPGKAMLFGEYAVLEGAPAIVAAVDRYALATTGGASATSPFVAEAIAEARRWLAARGLALPASAPIVDSSALFSVEDAAGARRKLGLGSSAAVTVAAFGALLEAAGAKLPSTDRERSEAFVACDAAHARAQGGRGSGADVAAAVWGGIVRFLRPRRDGSAVAPLVAPVALAPSIEVTLVDTGAPASTGERLERLSALRARDPARYLALLRPLADLAAAVAGEVETTGEVPVAAVVEWNLALDALAAALDVAIVTEPHRAVAAAARAAGGAAKPSGAGGGDLAVCFTPVGAGPRLRAELARHRLAPLPVTVGAPGLSTVAAPSPAAPKESAR